MTIRIDSAQAVQLLREVVAEHGRDTVYAVPGDATTCVYQWDGDCSCLVGHGLHRAGVTLDQLAIMDDCTHAAICDVTLPNGVALTDGAVSVFRAAQDLQDLYCTWGEALDAAEVQYRDMGVA